MAKKIKETKLTIVPKESKLSFEQDFQEEEENRLKIRPEDIVRFKEENSNSLPIEYNPYGESYSIEKSKFLDDTEPCPQFRKDGSRIWEVINNGDSSLTPVYFSMPTPPDLTLIDGYGLDRDEQYFRRLEIPRKFKLIEAKALKDLAEIEKKNRQDTVQGYKIYIRFWEIVEEEQENLEDEIIWIKKVWWHRTYGYWYYNDGEPVFIPPDYFDFLNFYYIDEAVTYPEYRDDIRRKFCFARYLESCIETFKDLDDSGRAKKNDEGKYEMIDLGRRLFFGDCEPKTRRTGATHEAVHKILMGAMTNLSYFSTIISFEGNNAETHYKKKLLPAFDAYPMVLKPVWEGNRRPNILRLNAPPNNYSIKGGLKSAVAFSDSGGVFANDGDRLNGVLNDEQGKDSNLKVDIFERWHVNKYTMSTGMGINILKGAYVKNPSTVEQLESSSVPYYKMCMMSDFYRRIPIKGQTQEGFARIFLPAYLRLEGYIDRFGKSVLSTPTERQIRLSPFSTFAVSKKGAKDMMQAERDMLLQINTPESLEAYRSVRRKSPFEWAECWLGSGGNVGYNLEIVDKRISEINKLKSLDNPPWKTGFFYRENNDPNGRVLWETSTERAKFKMSMDIPIQLTNQREGIEVWDGLSQKQVTSWRPLHGQLFTCGIDPFRNLNASQSKANKKEGFSLSNSRQSDGGIAILWEYDQNIDHGKEKKDWDSFKCILSYRYRPATQEEYFEDVIMACQYYGSMMYPEQNVEAFIAYVYKRGYGGYFLFDIGLDGKPKALPGKWTGTETQQDMIREYKDYIESRGHKENHDDLLMEIKSFRGCESFTRLDLKTAFGFALLGSKSRYREILGGMGSSDNIALDSIF